MPNNFCKQIVDGRLLKAKAVVGFFPANRVGDDIELYTDENRTHVLDVFHTLRQQAESRRTSRTSQLADFIAPKETGLCRLPGCDLR